MKSYCSAILLALFICCLAACATPTPTATPVPTPTPAPAPTPAPFGVDLRAVDVRDEAYDEVIPKHWQTRDPSLTRYQVQEIVLQEQTLETCSYVSSSQTRTIVRMERVVQLALVDLETGDTLAESPSFASQPPAECPSMFTTYDRSASTTEVWDGVLPADEVLPWLQQAVWPVVSSNLILPVTTGMPLPDVRAPIGAQNASQAVELARWGGHPGTAKSLSFSSDGQMLLVGVQEKGALWLRSMLDGEVMAEFDTSAEVLAAALAPGGDMAVGGTKNALVAWDTKHGKQIRKGSSPEIRALSFTADGTRLAVGMTNGMLQILDPKTGETLYKISTHNNEFAFALAPGGEALVTVTWQEIKLWDLSGDPDGWAPDARATIEDATGYTRHLRMAYAPDGASIVTLAADNAIYVLAMPSGERLHSLSGQEGTCLALAYSPDGATIACSTDQGTIALWEAETGTLSATLRGHTQAVEDILFSPTGQFLVSGSQDGTVRVWGIAP